MPATESIDSDQLQRGPIRHESLSPELLKQIEVVFGVIGSQLDTTLEQFEIGFMRDQCPEYEAAVWCGIAATWLAYHEQYSSDETLSEGDECKLLCTIISISTGIEDVTKLNVPTEIGERLLQCYQDLWKA